jgi:hypothetical protein
VLSIDFMNYIYCSGTLPSSAWVDPKPTLLKKIFTPNHMQIFYRPHTLLTIIFCPFAFIHPFNFFFQISPFAHSTFHSFSPK